ncbi:MAG: pantoate--beta-alanine ligase [Armatimonadota bacterium]
MVIARTIADAREAVAHANRVLLVPTMGAFHEGHLSLIRTAVADRSADGGVVAVSLFVNPAQFNDPRDLETYPRNEERDLRLAEECGADVLFAPPVSEVYPRGAARTRVVPAHIASRWEGERRPGHFVGVATVVAKLFHVFLPGVAYFGEKDWQQCRVIAEMVEDLDFPVWLRFCPTVRESDGLAMSSRNARLSEVARSKAPALYRSLVGVAKAVVSGEEMPRACQSAIEALLRQGFGGVDYFAVVDEMTLEPAEAIGPGLRVIGAATLEGVRLIDNVPVEV